MQHGNLNGSSACEIKIKLLSPVGDGLFNVIFMYNNIKSISHSCKNAVK